MNHSVPDPKDPLDFHSTPPSFAAEDRKDPAAEDGFFDIVDLVTEESAAEAPSGDMPPDEALLDCLNRTGTVDLREISRLTGLTPSDAAAALSGAIYQDPSPFLEGEPYDPIASWYLSCRYLSGNIRRKLREAEEANRRFGGAFSLNEEKLRSIVPERVDIHDIHITLGASFIPVSEVEAFLVHLLNLKEPIKVEYYADLLRYRIEETTETKKSVLNNITYGVREDLCESGLRARQYLTAIDIVEKTLNGATIKVYDSEKRFHRAYFVSYTQVLNEEKTLEAQEKQSAIENAFDRFIRSDRERMNRLEEAYNENLTGYLYNRYDGTFLRLPGLNPKVSLYPHQRDAIARILLSGGNLLLAHSVGAGKTYEMIVSAHELHRMGLSKKNLIVTPNAVLKAASDTHRYLYPEDDILVIYPKDFTPEKRKLTLRRVRDTEQVAIYMPSSAFDMLTVSERHQIDLLKRDLSSLTDAIYNARDKYEHDRLEARRSRLKKEIFEMEKAFKKPPYPGFEELGIETLIVDEIHNYKNLEIESETDGIVGMSGGSKKCNDMLEKTRVVPRLIFATGTPLTNSMTDLFVLQTYLQPEALEYHKLSSFDAWINTFGKREHSVEVDADAGSTRMRVMTRFSSFHNLSELLSLCEQVIDFHYEDASSEGLPLFRGRRTVCVPRSRELRAYIDSLSERTDLIRARKVKRREDNLLKVTSDGRKAALDLRLVDPSAAVDPKAPSKLGSCADKVYELYLAYPDSVQVVFSDLGTPKDGYNVYDDLASRLVALGIPRHEIAFAHDATGETARALLFEAMNKARVRVVIGSTQKLGVGVNVQERLVALHHLSTPWRPGDMLQREGRIIRKGNTCPEVFIYRYITEGSFDAYSYQILENKERFISAFLSGISATREIADIGDTVLDYAEVKALAIGNPLIKQRVETANSLERTKISFRSRQRELQDLLSVTKTLPAKAEKLLELSCEAEKDFNHFLKNRGYLGSEERAAFGEELFGALRGNLERPEERFFGDYRGFRVLLPPAMNERHPYVLLEGQGGIRYYAEMDLERPSLGCTKVLDYLLEHLFDRSRKLLEEWEHTEKQIDEAQKELMLGNPHEGEVERLTKALEEIDKRLEEENKDEDDDE